MKVTVKQVRGTTFAAKGDSNHWVIIDNAEKDDGAAAGSSAVEMVLMGLGACASVDVLLILKKSRARVEGFEVNLDAERAEDHPRVFTRVKMNFKLRGENIKTKDVERAIKLSLDKYCTVAGMIEKTAKIETTFDIS